MFTCTHRYLYARLDKMVPKVVLTPTVQALHLHPVHTHRRTCTQVYTHLHMCALTQACTLICLHTRFRISGWPPSANKCAGLHIWDMLTLKTLHLSEMQTYVCPGFCLTTLIRACTCVHTHALVKPCVPWRSPGHAASLGEFPGPSSICCWPTARTPAPGQSLAGGEGKGSPRGLGALGLRGP